MDCITGRSTSTSTRLRVAEPAPPAGLVFPDRRLIIMVQSCEKYENRRVACRETWVPEAREAFEVLFYTGTEKCVTGCGGKPFIESITGDVLTVASYDRYEHQVMKSAALFRWLAKHRDGAWVLRVDDDTLVRPDLLRKFLHTATGDYHGFPLPGGPGQYASGGAGILLSPQSVELLSHGLTRDSGWEDVEIGRTLAVRGIQLTPCDRLRPFCNGEPGQDNEPGPENDYITGHCKGPKPDSSDRGCRLMRQLWARLRGGAIAEIPQVQSEGSAAALIDARELGERATYWGTNSGHWGPALMCLFGLAVARGARSILEIGVWTGGSTRAFLAACQAAGGTLTSIDIDPECRQRVGERSAWDFRCGDSRQELAQLQREGYRCDLALVDGDHSYEYATAELAAVEAMLDPGGLIVVDDVWDATPGVIEAFHQFVPRSPARKTLIRYGWNEEHVGGRDKRTFGLIDYREA